MNPPSSLADSIARRPSHLKKGEWGHVLVLGGSSQLAGAAVLNTLGALRTGVDIVVMAGPERAANAVLHTAPDAITIALPGRHFETKFLKFLSQFKKYTVVLGSGITTQGPVKKFVKHTLDKFDGPFVIDADALRIVADIRNPHKLWKGKKVLLMPNRGEQAILAGGVSDQRQGALELAKRYHATVLCTGPVDVLSDGEQTIEIPGGSEFAAKGGTGDVLAGSCGALMAHGLRPFDAAKVACALLNEASRHAEREHGPGLLAVDVAHAINPSKLRTAATSRPAGQQAARAAATPNPGRR